jgi:hypothetical protein
VDHGQRLREFAAAARQRHVPVGDRQRLQTIPQVRHGDEQVLDLIEDGGVDRVSRRIEVVAHGRLDDRNAGALRDSFPAGDAIDGIPGVGGTTTGAQPASRRATPESASISISARTSGTRPSSNRLTT